MKIVADENIPFVRDAFEKLGEVVTHPGRRIDSAAVREADILLIRSITRANEDLLKESRVRFVATATIGCDHIDIDYLKSEGIQFASAAGCNANSVAEYVAAALLILARRYNLSLSQKSIGVVGVGNVGSRVVEKADILGMNVLQNDPPLARKTHCARFHSMKEILERSDILTLHVPLSYEGEDATYHMVNGSFLERMKEGSFLINTSRGAVVERKALLTALKQNRLGGAVLDVWENEPKIDENLLLSAALATPHIAGYSLDGKTRATVLIYQAVCQFLTAPCDWQPKELSPPPCPKIEVAANEKTDEEVLAKVVEKAYDLERDDRALRKILEIPHPSKRTFFDRLRSEYPVRREFDSIDVCVKEGSQKTKQKLKALGFNIVDH